MISTNALGLGLGKSDFRFVCHTPIPQLPTHYYQENVVKEEVFGEWEIILRTDLKQDQIRVIQADLLLHKIAVNSGSMAKRN